MYCKNHFDKPAVGSCAGCAQNFCKSCLKEIQGNKYCSDCQVIALQSQSPIPKDESEHKPSSCSEASTALVLAIIGLFCFGIILGPIAIYKALEAKKQIAAEPGLQGSGQATAALVIGIIDILGFLIFIAGMG